MSPSRKRGEKSLTRLTNELSHGEGKEQLKKKIGFHGKPIPP